MASIPRHVTAYVGGRNEAIGRYYALWKNGQMLVIQATTDAIPYIDYGAQPVAQAKLDRDHRFGLQRIQTLLDVVEFGRTNWAYLIVRDDGSYRLLYRNKPLYAISCLTWAPLVDESEITITKFINCEDRHGFWDGNVVSISRDGNHRVLISDAQ